MSKPSGAKLRRPSGSQPPKRTYKLLCEGERTEADYLNQFQRLNRHVQMSIDPAGFGCAPLAMVHRAKTWIPKTRGRRREIDEIWCIFDVDEHPNLNQAVHEARDAGINVAVTSPCFELWIVLHHQDHTANIHRHDVQRMCAEKKWTDGKALVPGTAALAADACERAERLDEKHVGDGSLIASNPSSGMRALVAPILVMAG